MTETGLLTLSPEQKQFFAEQGYLLLPGLHSETEIAIAREQMNAILRSPGDAHPRMEVACEPVDGQVIAPDNPHRVWKIMDTPLAGDWWFQQFQEPRVLDAVVDCLGPDIDFHNGKARIKPPGYHTHQGWHQDWPYERHSHPELLAAITYLDDTSEEAASTWVVPGSHLRGEWPCEADNTIPAEVVGTPGIPICARAGDVALIHVLVVHRAGANSTSKNRSCIINEYKTHRAVDLWGNRCAFADMPLRRGGRPLG